jgi:hypothetical protein
MSGFCGWLGRRPGTQNGRLAKAGRFPFLWLLMPKPPLRSGFFLLLLGVILLTLALVVRSGIFARKYPGEPINAAMREAMDANSPELTTKESLLVEQLYPTAAVTASGLRFVVRRPGTGPTPLPGSLVTANYAGRLLDGTPFDSSYQRGVPFTFRDGTRPS